MTDVLEFNEIAQEIKGAMNGGRLKLSKQGVAFKNSKTGKVDQIHAEDMQKTNWLKVARGYELKLYTNSGSIFKYDGFKDSDQERVSNFIKNHFDLELEHQEMSLKGWNWGTASFRGSELQFAVDKKAAFHLPLGNVSHSTTAKNEVILEFHQNDDAEVSLMEMRFYVPPTEADTNPVEAFHEKILAKADIIQATGDALCSIEQIPCLTPRGRYDIKMFQSFLQLHGKTFDYKIPYTTVLRLFLLPHKDNRQMYFILSLDPPIVQGQTRYHFLILSFNKEETLTLEINITEEELEEKYAGKLQKEMTGASFEIVSRLMKALTGRKITIPGSFSTNGGAKTISCSHKSNSGFLYPLERGFMYVHKPPIHIRFDEISCVNFSRGTGSTTRYFDFEIEVRNGTVYVFSSIDKNEYGPLFDYVSGKKLRVKNRGMKTKKEGINYDELMDSDDEGDHDAYLEQMKREGKERDEDDEDYVMNDDSDESDEDFDPDVGEASDVELEYDSNASESSDSDEDYTAGSDKSEMEEGELKRKKHKESKKAKKRAKTVSEKPRRRRKKNKKDEDPNKPKRPPSAYMLWLNENREEIKSKVPEGAGVADVAKKAGEVWNNMETAEKEKWQEKASEAKRDWQKAMTEYNKRKEEEGGGDEDEEEEEEGTPKKKKAKKEKKEKKTSPSPKKSMAGSGANYKSKEYIESSESSSDEDKKKKKKSEASKKVKSEKKKSKKESEKEESEKEESEKEESVKEESEKEESEKEESEKEESEKEESAKEESEKEESEKEASEAENEASGSEAGSD